MHWFYENNCINNIHSIKHTVKNNELKLIRNNTEQELQKKNLNIRKDSRIANKIEIDH